MSRKKSYRGADQWTKKAHRQGYAARSVFKLSEIDQRVKLLKRGQRAVDLGCYPGSWSRYLRERIGPDGALVGVDLDEPQGIPGAFLVASVYDVTADQLRDALGGPCDVLVSDMAPPTTGDRFGDHARQIRLVWRALELADELLAPGGAFVAKVFEGEDAPAVADAVRQRFRRFRRIKPKATRGRSVELFVVGQEYAS